MLPIIGITSSAADKTLTSVQKTYVNAVAAAGGIPVVLPNKPGFENEYLAACNGLLFSGGGDVQAKYFSQDNHEKVSGISEERDMFEITLARLAFEAKKPLLGICRGEQVINVALGGNLIQHIDGHDQKDARSTATHSIDITDGTKLRKWLGQSSVRVNSFHHQLADKLAPGFIVTARSAEGFTEAYEYSGDWFCACYQWHPEAMLESPEHALMIELFRPFIEACK
ncbi:MAG: gamma-glutamyl-gamma-aminobutyrate hydrolase family protein [Defluviitaleaceae bacterium]|nr:gamma-glutamyl-gamma-aminobutyrate hydrolase family protein [Defluviitaleaceae bacterium]MCL2835533.1 gamma-glutamyl-gamma-aminobutyrate hydrolase family protein [Defluviitaleaceae bacterium]